MSIRSSWYSLGRLVLVLFCLTFVLALAIFVLPIRLDVTAFKRPIERALAFFVEAPTTVDRVYLDPSLWPTLTLEGLEVAGTGSLDAPRFSRAESLKIRIALLPLARRRLQVLQLRAIDLEVSAQRRPNQPGNWPVRIGKDWQIIELADIQAEGITVRFDDHELGRGELYLDSLRADISQTRPLDLSLRGSFENEPLGLRIAGPTLESLAPRASDFPLSSSLELSDLHVELAGTLSRQPDGLRYRLQLEVGSPSLEFLQPFLDGGPPAVDGIDLTGNLSNRDGWIDLRELQGRFGATSLHGSLSLGKRDSKPIVEGRLVADQFDYSKLAVLITDSKSGSDFVLDLSPLDRVDAELEIEIQRVTGTELGIENASIDLGLRSGRLTAPVTCTLMGIPVNAKVDLYTDSEQPAVEVTGQVTSMPVTVVDRWIEIDEYLTGDIASAALQASARGRTLDELAASLAIQLDLEEADLQLHAKSRETPLDLALKQTRIHQAGDLPLTLSTRGSLLGQSFLLEAKTAPLDQLFRAAWWPLDARLQGTGIDLRVEGEFLPTVDPAEIDVDFEVEGDDLGELEGWFGVSTPAELPFQLRGHVLTEGGSRRLDLETVRLGRTRFSSTARWIRGATDPPPSIVLDAETVDPRELANVFHPITRLDADTERLRIDLPLLPGEISFRDADIDIEVERFLRSTTDLTAVDTTFQFRDGKLQRSPFSFGYNDLATFRGQLELDLTSAIPHFGLSVSAAGQRLGQMLELEGLVEHSPVTLTGLQIEIDARGSSIRQILRSSDLSMRFDDVCLTLATAEMETRPEARFEHIALSGPAGQPLVLEADGRFEQQPVHMRIEIVPPAHTDLESHAALPMHLEVDVASTQLTIDGTFQLPLTDRHFAAQFHVSGADLSTLSSLLGRSLPAIGPYRLDTGLSLREGVVELSDLNLKIGESRLQGTLDLDTRGERPWLAATLTSPRLRMVDLMAPPAVTDQADEEGRSSPLRSTANLELAFLDRFDADLDVAIDTLESHARFFSDVTLDARLDHGALEIHAQRPTENGDTAQIEARLQHAGDAFEGTLSLHWNRQPYGAIVDLLGLTGAEGSWSTSINLSTRGKDAEELLAGLSGQIDFTDYPSGFKATVLDLWGGGLIESVLPVFGVGKESRLNCTVGRFQVENGVMTPEVLLVDTTRNRVRGKGSIDLAADHMKLKLIPRPKQRNLINLATPVVMSGSVTDPAIRVSTRGLAVTWFRLSLWVYTVWRDLLRQPLPADGSDVCVDPPRRSEPALTAAPADRP